MKRSSLALFALLVATVPAAAQTTSPRTVRSAVRTASTATQAAPERSPTTTNATPMQTAPTPPTPPAPPTTPPAICCCRVWSHGWQYSWRPNAECTTQSGSCVTPDHC